MVIVGAARAEKILCGGERCVVLVCVIVVLKKKREAVTSIVSRVLQRKFLFSSEFSVRVTVFVLFSLLKSFVWLRTADRIFWGAVLTFSVQFSDFFLKFKRLNNKNDRQHHLKKGTSIPHTMMTAR